MKNAFLFALLAFSCFSLFAQVQVTKPVDMNGSTNADRRIKNVGSPADTGDAANAATVQSGGLIFNAASGSAGNYTANLYPVATAYTTGMVVNFKANHTNTGAVTLKINSLAAKPLKKAVTQSLVAGDIGTDQMVSAIYDGTNFQLISGTGAYYKNCKAIKADNASAASGVYTIDPDAEGASPPMSCYCDMTTDGGGWTLILNYLHQAGTNPALNVRTTTLPLLGSTTLGTNEGGTNFWGHASTALMNILSFTEMRWYGKTSHHARTMDFIFSSPTGLSYFKTGVGQTVWGNYSTLDAAANPYVRTLTGHGTFLPNSADSQYKNQGDYSLTEFPFYNDGDYTWGIHAGNSTSDAGGLIKTTGGGNRWEVDNNSRASADNTHHQIWIR